MFSRREWIICLSVFAGLTHKGTSAESSNKITQAAAKYQDHPNNMQMCGMCKFYIPSDGHAGSGMMNRQMGPGMMGGQMRGMMRPGTCELVEGSISPRGWCVLYRPVSR